MSNTSLRLLPGVDTLLEHPVIKPLVERFGHPLSVWAARAGIELARSRAVESGFEVDLDAIAAETAATIRRISEPSMRPIINGTGVVIHTNIGRAPLGRALTLELARTCAGYCNLEFDLDSGGRGSRIELIRELLRFVTGAEDAVVVNNNAAAVLLILKTFAEGREVIISRGELIEIGGSFRIPEIMAAGGARMVEVGTTNRTHLRDYEEAITENTAVIFKAHKSNFYIGGFTEDVDLEELAALAREHNLLLVYDIGSGLLRKPESLDLEREPDVKSSLSAGADLVCFSGDKLLGGPQAGIVVGKGCHVERLARHPMMRALRVGKLTLAALSFVVRAFLRDEDLLARVPLFAMLDRKPQEIERLATKLLAALQSAGVAAEIIDSKAQVGGGTLPHLVIDSRAVRLLSSDRRDRHFAEKVHHRLLQRDKPVLGILREGSLLFDVLSLFDDDIPVVAEAVKETL
ncbi:MAG: L-seryl-tRNA(Sec) selenium transferase [Candidatus Cloacimonetes bacterium]|nr:L-seryl-tRNA(Sec) selenium transferase [Candidatus Cloacimonadota bacterium]